MSAGAQIDYESLAKQAGAVSYQPPQGKQGQIDYAALAKQAGAISSQEPGQTPGASQITGISAQPQPSGWRDSVSRWADNVMNDVKNGTDVTGIGTVLKKMGAHGVYSGEPEAVGDFMASLPLGLARMTKGGAEVTQEKS